MPTRPGGGNGASPDSTTETLPAVGGNGHGGDTWIVTNPPAGDDTTAVATRPMATATRRRSRPRRDGVIVPLRVPVGTRLKAGLGLFALVVVLGTVAAVIVAGIAFAGAQALAGL